jgi:hypothetical protein
MREGLVRTVMADPERMARVEAIAVRVASERVHQEQDEREQAEAERLAKKPKMILALWSR